jgi:molecular chaperone DnaK (HSP70)
MLLGIDYGTTRTVVAAVDCVFRAKVATDSGRILPPIPGEGCH